MNCTLFILGGFPYWGNRHIVRHADKLHAEILFCGKSVFCKSMFSNGPMKYAIVVPQEEANIEKKPMTATLPMTFFPHWLSPTERGHRTEIKSSS